MSSLKISDCRCHFIFRNHVSYYELDVDELKIHVYKYHYTTPISSIISFAEVHTIVHCNIKFKKWKKNFTERNFTNGMDVHVNNRYLEETVQTINVTKIIVKPVWILLSCHPELLYNPYHRKKIDTLRSWKIF